MGCLRASVPGSPNRYTTLLEDSVLVLSCCVSRLGTSLLGQMKRCLVLSVCLAGLLPWVAFSAAQNELTSQEKAEGWKLLFDGSTTSGWQKFKNPSRQLKGWTVEDGWLHATAQGGGDIVSADQYEHFELKWEWKLAKNGNSGVKYFVTETRNSALGHEYQMIDDERNQDAKVAMGKHVTGSFYDVLAPTVNPPVKPPGEIKSSGIVVKDNHVEHWLNGVKVLEYDCGSEVVKSAVAKSKFKTTAGFGTCLKGHILLQDHGTEVWFRNIKIRVL